MLAEDVSLIVGWPVPLEWPSLCGPWAAALLCSQHSGRQIVLTRGKSWHMSIAFSVPVH